MKRPVGIYDICAPILLSLCQCFSGRASAEARSIAQGDLCYVESHRCMLLYSTLSSIALTGCAAAVANNQLYFEGGQYTFKDGYTSEAGQHNICLPSLFNSSCGTESALYWINLNASFPVNGLILTDWYDSISAPGDQWANTGAYWTDKDLTTLYSIGGHKGADSTATNKLSSFNATTQSWFNTTVEGGNFNSLSRNFASSATTSTSGLGLGFLTGGLEATANPQGMIRFDASDPSFLSWQNETYAPHLVGATMQYVRFGNKGILVVVGGYEDVCPTKTLWNEL